ncbi:MAG: DUF2190 family protein [Candidatus Sumerlaeaceae bacterium]|nr:DUF2190 family protein [Candidatus Sumerlaeaceae bacterium]
MPIYLMDKTYRVATPSGVAANRVVVQGPLAGDCALPAEANAGAILGVTVHAQPSAGRSVSVRKAGIAEVTAAGPIPAGAPVNIADAAGRVKAVNEPADTRVQCLGFAETRAAAAGDIIDVFISIHERTATGA